MIPDSPLAIPDEPWARASQPLVLRVFRGRLVVVPALGLVFTVFFLFDPVPWKLAWIAVTALIAAALSLFEYWRIQRSSLGVLTIQANVSAILVLQTAIIFISGGIESPVLPAYVPFGLIAGLALPSLVRVTQVAAIPVGFTLLFAASAQLHWLPRTTPSFFDLGPGFADRPVYVWTRTGILVLIIFIGSAVGVGIRRSFEAIERDVAEARKGALDGLEARNRDILSVASTVAHELKNPLSSIQGLAQLMARSAPAGSKDAERLEVMRREVARMSTVLDEFRNFSRPLAALSLQRVRLRGIIRDVVVLEEGRAEARGIDLELRPGDDALLTCDPQKVKQAVLNLVHNALEASPVGGSVDISLRIDPRDSAQVVVRDSGPGLRPDVADKLFTPGLTTKEHGTGIGLVVARSIAEQHGGTVTLASQASGGCEAVLSLPLHVEHPAEGAPRS